MERERDISKHEAIVQPFIKGAFKEGAHRIKPKYLSENHWNRQIMIGVVYNDVGSTAAVGELGEKNGNTRQNISLLNKSFLKNLWNNCSPELQERHRLDEILAVRKPLSQISRERHSAVRGGRSLRIKEQVESGETNVEAISANTGISKGRIMNSRKLLKDWRININVPREKSSYKESLEELDKETDDKKIQELLDGFPYFVIYYDMTKRKEASRFCSLLSLIREAGFHPHNTNVHFFETSLKKACVPITRKDRVVAGTKPHILTYYDVVNRHKDRAIQVFREDKDLQRFQKNPVKMICGATKDNIPTTTKLVKKQGYEVVGKALKEFGIIIGGSRSKIRYSDIFIPDCPVPIYRYYKNYYYPVTQKKALRSFIAKKLNL